MDEMRVAHRSPQPFVQMVSVGWHSKVLPALVPIYDVQTEPRERIAQVGTGFLMKAGARTALVTAKHVLYGHDMKEPPLTKQLVFQGGLRAIGELSQVEIVRDLHHDLAAFYFDECNSEAAFGLDRIDGNAKDCSVVTVGGFLARDLEVKGSIGMIRPAPMLYTNNRAAVGEGHLGLRVTRSDNQDLATGRYVRAPVPRGLSGAPMFDAVKLSMREVSIVGVFIEYHSERSLGLGESSSKIVPLLDSLASNC